MPPGAKDPYHLALLRRGLEVLGCFARRPSWSLAELAVALGQNKATLFRVLHTLEAAGYLAKDAAGRYAPGLALHALGNATVRQEQLRWLSLPPLQALAEETGETVHVGILHEGEVVTVQVVEGILGTERAAPERPCVAVVGDGSFLMTPHALATAVEYDIPVVWVVWNNAGFCSIRDIQHGMFGGRELATAFEIRRTGQSDSPDFAMMAKSMGVASHRVTHAGEVEDAIATAIRANRPYLVEVPVDREIRPIGTGSWDLPPLPNPEPNFLKALAARGITI